MLYVEKKIKNCDKSIQIYDKKNKTIKNFLYS